MLSTRRPTWIALAAIGLLVLLAAAAGGTAAADAPTETDLEPNATTTDVDATTTDVDGIEWRNPSSNAGFQGFDPADTTFAITPNVLIDGELAMDESVAFEITNEETDSSVTISPTEAADDPFSDRVRFNLFDRSGDLVEEPHIENVFGDEEVDAEIEGDADTFTEMTIADYDVTLLVDGEELASAEPRELTIGYSPQPEARTDGDRLVVTTAPSGIDADRDVEFELYEDDDHDTGPVRADGVYNADIDRFVYEFDRDEFELDAAPEWGVTIDRTEDGTVFSGSNWQSDLEIEAVDEIDIDVPEEDDDADDAPDDGDDTDETPDVPDGEALVSLAPAERTAVGGDEVTYDVVLAGLDEGLSSYDVTVTVSDTELATITNASVERESGFGDEQIAADGSSVHLERALGDDTYEPTDEVVLGQVTVETTAADDDDETPDVPDGAVVEVGFDDSTLNDLDSVAYDSTFESATLEVVDELPAPDVTGDGQPATDTNGDGKLNDLDGSGEFGINDVQILFENRNSNAIRNNPDQFDFSGDGNVGIADVQALFEQLQQGS